MGPRERRLARGPGRRDLKGRSTVREAAPLWSSFSGIGGAALAADPQSYACEMAGEEGDQPVGPLVENWSPRPMPAKTQLRGRYVTADPIGARHTEALFDAVCGANGEGLWTYRPGPVPTSPAEFQASVVDLLEHHDGSASFAFLPDDVDAAGFATFYPCVPESGVLEISGVLFGRSMQGTTAGTEAIHLMLRYAFDELGYRRVEWKCDSLNERSRRAAHRLGFRYEGRFRQHMVTNGRNRDTDWYSILDTEWVDVRDRHARWLAPENFNADGQQRRRLERRSGPLS